MAYRLADIQMRIQSAQFFLLISTIINFL